MINTFRLLRGTNILRARIKLTRHPLFLCAAKKQLEIIDEEIEELNKQILPRNPNDERDDLIERLKDVNTSLRAKVGDLQEVVEKAVEKAKQATRQVINTHREWGSASEEVKEREKQLKAYQAQINGYKKEISSLKNRIDSLSNTEKMIDLENDLRHSERRRKELEKQKKVLEANNKEQQKELNRLAGDVDYENKIRNLLEELKGQKEKYRKLEKDHRAKEGGVRKHHEEMMKIEEENIRLKRMKIALKNNRMEILESEPNEVPISFKAHLLLGGN